MKWGRIFHDRSGNLVLWQAPNIPIVGWLACTAIAWLLKDGPAQAGFQAVATAFLFTWAFLELTQGVNYFRRALGLVVMAVIIFGFFG